MPKKKILIFIDWFLPGTNSGGPIQSYANLIEYFKEEYDFYVVTRNIDYESDEPYEGIVSGSWNRLSEHLEVHYLFHNQLRNTDYRKIINSKNFDLALVNGIYSWYFSILPVFFLKKSGIPTIISARGMLSPQGLSVKKLKKLLFLFITKITCFYRELTFHATNDDEAVHIRGWIGKKNRIKIASNLPKKIEAFKQAKLYKSDPVRFVYVGRVSPEKGTLTVIDNLIKINFDRPVILDIYGPIYDKTYWGKCVESINNLPELVSVFYKGSVTNDVLPEVLYKYDFFILLSEGENFGHSIIEAMSAGLPVIISDLTPWKNLEKRSIGWDVDPKNEKEIHRVLKYAVEMNDELYNKFSTNSYNFAAEFNESSEIINQNKKLLEF